MKKILSTIFLISTFIACQNNKKCESFYNDFLDLKSESNYENALLSINKAVECDFENEDLRFQKVQLLILLNDYSKAKKELLELGNLNEIFLTQLPLYGALEFKDGNLEKGKNKIKQVYKKLSKIDFTKDNFNLYYYKLLSQMFSINEGLILKEIQNQNLYQNKHEQQSLDFLEKMIKSNKNKVEILYKGLGID